jgi:hypothetical protein
MANEISATLNLSLKNLGLTDPGPNLGQISINQTNQLLFNRTVTLVAGVDTDVGALIVGLTTFGIGYLYNLDPTNYVQWGPNNGGAINVFGRLTKNDIPAVFRFDPTAPSLRMKANAGNCIVRVCVYDD